MNDFRAEWERLAATLAPHTADAIEENVAEEGYELESDDFWARCCSSADCCAPAIDLIGPEVSR